ncbi:MAG: proprotein convertase P-domain-containing protein [Sedimentisphaerales bacterium]|nr:proprotein convertase P-domain-containing protein [Sedimentisphaerales bacterium]
MNVSIKILIILTAACISLLPVAQANATVHSYILDNVSEEILDNDTITSNLYIQDSFIVQDVNVILFIEHTWVADLEVSLVAPDGREIELFSDVGSSGANFEGTILDEQADISIVDGQAPFTGSYRPENSLLDFTCMESKGTWKLKVEDTASEDNGTLISWGLILDSSEIPPAANNPSPPDTALDLAVNTCLSWDVGNVTDDMRWDLYLGTNPDSLVRIASDLNDTSYCPGPLVAGTRYYWRVNIKNLCLTTQGPIWSFDITLPPVAKCRNITVTADRSCQLSVTVDDIDWFSYDPNGDPITRQIDSSGPFSVGVHNVTLTVTDDKGASDSCVSTVTVLPTAYCYTTEAMNELWSLIAQDPTSQLLKQAVDLLSASLGESLSYNTIAESEMVHVFWAGPDRVSQLQGGFAGTTVFDYQQQACVVLKSYLQARGPAYEEAIYGIWRLVAQSQRKLAETAIADSNFEYADAAMVEQAETLIRDADTITELLRSEIPDTALPKYEQAWMLAVENMGTVVDWNRDGTVAYKDFISFFDEWLANVAP